MITLLIYRNNLSTWKDFVRATGLHCQALEMLKNEIQSKKIFARRCL